MAAGGGWAELPFLPCLGKSRFSICFSTCSVCFNHTYTFAWTVPWTTFGHASTWTHADLSHLQANSKSKSISLTYAFCWTVLMCVKTVGEHLYMDSRPSVTCPHTTQKKTSKSWQRICKLNIPLRQLPSATSAWQQSLYGPIKHVARRRPSCFVHC